jgi:hypothetical protein
MGHRGHNELGVAEAFCKLSDASLGSVLLAHHRRRSGNFVVWDNQEVRGTATAKAREATSLNAVLRPFPALVNLDWTVPEEARLEHGSLVLPARGTKRRLIAVMLSEEVPESARPRGSIRPDLGVIAWSSDRDALCWYDRPGEPGSVGRVTRALVARVKALGARPDTIGSGRAFSVIRDLLAGRNLVRPAGRCPS